MTWNDIKCPYCGSDDFEIYDEYGSLVSPEKINKCSCNECGQVFLVATKEEIIRVERLD